MQFAKFIIVGASNTLLDFLLYLVLTRIAGVYFLTANVVAFLCAMTWSFFLNKRWTFHDRSLLHRKQYLKFFCVSCVALALSQGILFVSVHWLQWFDMVGKSLAIIAGIAWSFNAHRVWTFQ